jgi:hypothetical protein
MPKKLETQPWWGDFMRQKDSSSLRELAARYGVSIGGLVATMKRIGVDRSAQPPGRRRDQNVPTPTSVRTRATKVASAPSRPEASTAAPIPAPTLAAKPKMRQSKLSPFAHLIGTVPDAEVARRAGVTTAAVYFHRMRHGAPRFVAAVVVDAQQAPSLAPAGVPLAKPRGAQRTRAQPAPGVTTAVAAAAPASAPTAIVAAPTASVAWRVEFASGEARYVIARHATDALDRVTTAGLGDVVAILRAGAALA